MRISKTIQFTLNFSRLPNFNTSVRRFNPVMNRRGRLNFEQNGKIRGNVLDTEEGVGGGRLGVDGRTGVDMNISRIG